MEKQHARTAMENLVKRYVGPSLADFLGFMKVLDESEAVISGSSALNFFDATIKSFTPNDLDIFACEERWYGIHDFLSNRNYSDVAVLDGLLGSDANPLLSKTLGCAAFDEVCNYDSSGISNVVVLRRGELRVEIVISKRNVIDAILGFHSTIPMNFVTSSVAVSLYPRATFKDFVGIPASISKTAAVALEKYAHRGWKILRGMNNTPENLDFRGETRRVGDKHCLVLQYREGGMPLPLHFLSHTWSLQWIEDDSRVSMQHVILTSNMLDYSYCFCPKLYSEMRSPTMTGCTDEELALSVQTFVE